MAETGMLYPRRERSGLGLPFGSLGLESREEDGGIGVITTTDWVEVMEFFCWQPSL